MGQKAIRLEAQKISRRADPSANRNSVTPLKTNSYMSNFEHNQA